MYIFIIAKVETTRLRKYYDNLLNPQNKHNSFTSHSFSHRTLLCT